MDSNGPDNRRDDQQRHPDTRGGTKGFSLKGGALARYYLTSECHSRYLQQLRAVIGQQYTDFNHPDLQMSRIKRDEADVQSLVELKETS